MCSFPNSSGGKRPLARSSISRSSRRFCPTTESIRPRRAERRVLSIRPRSSISASRTRSLDAASSGFVASRSGSELAGARRVRGDQAIQATRLLRARSWRHVEQALERALELVAAVLQLRDRLVELGARGLGARRRLTARGRDLPAQPTVISRSCGASMRVAAEAMGVLSDGGREHAPHVADVVRIGGARVEARASCSTR